jgi:hypothetical protein
MCGGVYTCVCGGRCVPGCTLLLSEHFCLTYLLLLFVLGVVASLCLAALVFVSGVSFLSHFFYVYVSLALSFYEKISLLLYLSLPPISHPTSVHPMIVPLSNSLVLPFSLCTYCILAGYARLCSNHTTCPPLCFRCSPISPHLCRIRTRLGDVWKRCSPR